MATREIKKLRSKTKVDYNKSVLVVSRSNKNISVQLLEPVTKKVLFTVNSNNIKKGTKIEKATKVGQDAAKKLKSLKIESAVTDRNGYTYHGRIKAIFEAIKESGVKI